MTSAMVGVDAIETMEASKKKASPDSDYQEDGSAEPHSPTTSKILSKKKQQSELLFAEANIAQPKPRCITNPSFMPSNRQRRTSLNSQCSRDGSPSRRYSSRGKGVQVTKEQQARDLFSRYNASSNSAYPGPDTLPLVSIRLLRSVRDALEGLRGCSWTKEQMDQLIEAVDASEHHPGYVSETSWVEAVLTHLPGDELEFSQVIEHLTDALQWVQFQTVTEVVLGVHADKCGNDCDHLPVDIVQRLPPKDQEVSPAKSPASPRSSLAVRGRTNRLRRLYRRCAVQPGEGVGTGFLRSLGQVCQTLGHRTLKHCECTSTTCDEFVWSDEHYQNTIVLLDSQCNGVITESAFVLAFEERLPVDAGTFEAVVLQLEAGAKHLRNVEYATELNRQRHSSHAHSHEELTEPDSRGKGCVQRGCVSNCSVM